MAGVPPARKPGMDGPRGRVYGRAAARSPAMTATPAPADRAAFSIACALGGSVAFSLNDITVKSFSTDLPLHEVILIRAATALCVIVFAFGRGQSLRAILTTRRPGVQALRALFVVISNFAYFAGIAALPLAEDAAIFFVAPLLITALSAILLHEPVGARRWFALALGLAGVMLVVKPGTAGFQWAMLLPLAAALAYAGTQVATRSIGLTDSAVTLAVYTQLGFVVTCAMMGLAFGDGRLADGGSPAIDFLFRAWVLPGASDIARAVAAGVFSAIGGYLLGQAYRSSAAGIVAPFEYAALVLAAFWGYAIWGEWPDATSFAGIGLIFASGIFIALREAARGAPPSARRVGSRR